MRKKKEETLEGEVIRKAGRPSTYPKDAPQQLIQLMQNGVKSQAQIAAYFGITRRGLYDWKEQYPEFQEAYEIGVELAQAWWENVGTRAIVENTPKFNSSLYIFSMCNLFRQDYQQKNSESNINVNLNQNTLNLEKMSDEELTILLEKKQKLLGD